MASQGQTFSSYGFVFLRIRLLARDMDTDLAADAPLEVDFAPLLRTLHHTPIDGVHKDAVDRADFQARLTTGAVVGVDKPTPWALFYEELFFEP